MIRVIGLPFRPGVDRKMAPPALKTATCMSCQMRWSCLSRISAAPRGDFEARLTRSRQHRLRILPPRPLAGGKPNQVALDVVAAPVAQQRRGLFVLHPFGDGLDLEPAREVDQRLHEGAIIR